MDTYIFFRRAAFFIIVIRSLFIINEWQRINDIGSITRTPICQFRSAKYGEVKMGTS